MPLSDIVSDDEIKVNAIVQLLGQDTNDPAAELAAGNHERALAIMRGEIQLEIKKRKDETDDLADQLILLRNHVENETKRREEERCLQTESIELSTAL